MKVRRFKRDRGKSPWGIMWRVQGKQKAKFFQTREERDAAAKLISDSARKQGLGAFSVDMEKVALWRSLEARLGDYSISAAVEWFLNFHERIAKEEAIENAIDAYLDDLQISASRAHFRTMRSRCGKMKRHFASRKISDITTDDLRRWVNALHVAPLTRNHYLAAAHAVFEWAIRNRMCAINPAIGVARAKVSTPEPRIVPCEIAHLFFKIAEKKDPIVCAHCAISAFTGMRVSAVFRLKREDVQAGVGILTRAADTKKGRRHFIEGFPPTVWRFIRYMPPAWPATERKFYKRIHAVWNDVYDELKHTRWRNWRFPQNGWRHSFATYHCALEGSAAKTATILSHKGDTATFYEHYKGLATRADAKAYFAIGEKRNK